MLNWSLKPTSCQKGIKVTLLIYQSVLKRYQSSKNTGENPNTVAWVLFLSFLILIVYQVSRHSSHVTYLGLLDVGPWAVQGLLRLSGHCVIWEQNYCFLNLIQKQRDFSRTILNVYIVFSIIFCVWFCSIPWTNRRALTRLVPLKQWRLWPVSL